MARRTIFGELAPAEKSLLDAFATGEVANIGPTRPPQPIHENRIRSDFLRFLALGGNADTVIHEKGINLLGAWIDGDVDLQFCHLRRRTPVGSYRHIPRGPVRMMHRGWPPTTPL